eukprot:5697164-Lingulodinium_polyedra.AAC.1
MTCGQLVREQMPRGPLHCRATSRKQGQCHASSRVAFRQAVPHWQKSVRRSSTSGCRSNCTGVGSSHNMLVSGFSTAPGMPRARKRRTKRHAKVVTALAASRRA